MNVMNELTLKTFVLGAILGSLSGCGLPSENPEWPLATVAQIDLERYMGRWYEIARYPNSFEVGCSAVTADYELRDGGTVSVVNTCRGADGASVSRVISGFARVSDPATNAKLTVYFFYPFGAPYWIIDLDAEYQYAVVGDPSRTFLWILSRTPRLDPATYEQILQRLPAMGYDPTRLELTPQPDTETP